MTDDIGCKSITLRGGSPGHVVTCGVCDWCRARRVTELEAELTRWHDKCDEVGVPHDPDSLVRHHRSNAQLIGALNERILHKADTDTTEGGES